MNKPDLETCTLQEACDYAVFKIVEQGGQCVDDKKKCRYGNDEGDHCAVGWLLDHNNKQLMSCGDTVYGLSESYNNGELPPVITNNIAGLSLIQDFHDCDKKEDRASDLWLISKIIDTTAQQYQQWVEMGE